MGKIGVMKVGLILGVLCIVVLSSGYLVGEEVASSPEVTVIFQFGNQQVLSADVYLSTDNLTAIKATELACEQLGLYLNYTWSSYGALVNQIGWDANDWYDTGYYWHLMVWANDSYKWKVSSVGASSLILKNGEVIAWVYTVDNTNWYPYTGALAYPGHYGAWETPRGNINNTGTARGETYTPDIVWKFKGESSWGFSSTPVAGDGRIFIADSSGLYALNMNGSLLWTASKGAAGYYGIASPVLFGNYVIIGCYDEYLRAFYVTNGTLAWQIYLNGNITSAPVVDIVNKEPTVFVVTFAINSTGKLYAINLLNGSQEWNVTLMGSDYFGIPAVYGGRIVIPIAGIEDTSYVWHSPYGIQCIYENGSYAWNYTTESSVRSSPVIENENIYFVTTGGSLKSLNINGVERWSFKIGSSVSTPAVKNGTIYVGNNNGTLYGIKDKGSYGELLWKRQLNGPIQGGVIYVSGVVIAATNTDNGTLYFTFSNGTLYWNITLQPENYILSSPIVADSYVLIASNNGYLYALGNNLLYPSIGNIVQSTAYVGSPIRISFESSPEYQAILYYKNVTGDSYHAVWMRYENGSYIGYISPQSRTGNVYYYVTLVNPSGISTTSSLKLAQVTQPVPELNYLTLILVSLVILILFRNRVHG